MGPRFVLSGPIQSGTLPVVTYDYTYRVLLGGLMVEMGQPCPLSGDGGAVTPRYVMVMYHFQHGESLRFRLGEGRGPRDTRRAMIHIYHVSRGINITPLPRTGGEGCRAARVSAVAYQLSITPRLFLCEDTVVVRTTPYRRLVIITYPILIPWPLITHRLCTEDA